MSIEKIEKLESDQKLELALEDVDATPEISDKDEPVLGSSSLPKFANRDTLPLEFKKHYFSKKEPPNLLDYDAIGFTVDHCLVKYNTYEITRHII